MIQPVKKKFGIRFNSLFSGKAIFSACLMLISTTSHALNLGELTVKSKLNQPLDASIPVIASTEELASLKIRLASVAAFERFQIPKGKLLDSLQFVIHEQQGKPYIRVTTKAPIKEPLLEFVISLNWGNGKILRNFAVFLSP